MPIIYKNRDTGNGTVMTNATWRSPVILCDFHNWKMVLTRHKIYSIFWKSKSQYKWTCVDAVLEITTNSGQFRKLSMKLQKTILQDGQMQFNTWNYLKYNDEYLTVGAVHEYKVYLWSLSGIIKSNNNSMRTLSLKTSRQLTIHTSFLHLGRVA